MVRKEANIVFKVETGLNWLNLIICREIYLLSKTKSRKKTSKKVTSQMLHLTKKISKIGKYFYSDTFFVVAIFGQVTLFWPSDILSPNFFVCFITCLSEWSRAYLVTPFFSQTTIFWPSSTFFGKVTLFEHVTIFSEVTPFWPIYAFSGAEKKWLLWQSDALAK